MAAGESSTVQTYTFKDYDVKPGRFYYRIKQLDKDGSEDYSDIVELNIVSDKNKITLAPNPAKNKSILTLVLENDLDATVNIIGSDGRLIRTSIVEATNGNGINTALDINNLPAGVYSIHVNQGGFNEVKKLIIVD